MVTGPVYDGTGGHPALDFVNSVDRSLGKPWVDRLRSYADLLAWSAAAGTLPVERSGLSRAARARAAEAEAALAEIREVREALYRIFAALAAGAEPASDDLVRMNAALARALARSRIEPRDGGFAWSWDADGPPLELPLWPIVRAAAELLTSPERELVKRCASETCLWLFLDGTKNHARRWCDMKVCGNRAKVRRHRSRARD